MQNANDKLRKILIATGIVVIIAALLFWVFMSKKNTSDGLIRGFGDRVDNTDWFGNGKGIEAGNAVNAPGGSSLGHTPNDKLRPRPDLFLQLTDYPVAGTTLVQRDGKVLVRAIGSEDGHIADIDPSNAQGTPVTNTTFERGVSEALFFNRGNGVVVRYLERGSSGNDVIKTFLGNIAGDADTVSATRGSFLPDGIAAISVAPSGKKLFYLLPDGKGVTGIVHNFSTNKEDAVFEHSYRSWSPQMTGDNDVLLTTKASAVAPGYAYVYHIAEGTLERLLFNKNALMTNAAPGGILTLFTENILGRLYTGVYDMEAEMAENIDDETPDPIKETLFPFVTIPEKCAWTTDGQALYCGVPQVNHVADIPDKWYQGVLPLSDGIWKIDAHSGELTQFANPRADMQRDFDVTDPHITDDERYFIFTNKSDGFVWAVRLEPDRFMPPEDVLTPEEERDSAGSME